MATPTFPLVLYSLKWRVAPMVMNDQAELDQFAPDPSEWTTIPPPEAQPLSEDQWPKFYFDVNVPPIVVNSPKDLKTVDLSRYRELVLSEALVKAAQAALDAAKAKSQ